MPNPPFCLLHLPPSKIPRPRGTQHRTNEFAIAVSAAVDAAAAAAASTAAAAAARAMGLEPTTFGSEVGRPIHWATPKLLSHRCCLAYPPCGPRIESSSSWGRDALNCSKEIHCAWRSPGHLTKNSCLVLPLRVVVLVSRISVASWERAACPRVVAFLGNVLANVADSLNFLRNPMLIVL